MRIKEICKAQSDWVKQGNANDDTLQAKYYARPVSYVLTWLFIRLNVNANKITLMALICAIIGCFLFTLDNYWVLFTGAILFNIGHLLDYADGTLAKATHTVSTYGRFYDSISDEIVESIIPVAVGFAVGLPFYGALCAIMHLISVIVHLYTEKYFSVQSGQNKSLLNLIFKIGINIKALAVPLLLVAVIFDGLIFYFIMYVIMCACELFGRLISGVKV